MRKNPGILQSKGYVFMIIIFNDLLVYSGSLYNSHNQKLYSKDIQYMPSQIKKFILY